MGTAKRILLILVCVLVIISVFAGMIYFASITGNTITGSVITSKVSEEISIDDEILNNKTNEEEQNVTQNISR
jgi:flagellar basal body-associated protein FliL